MRAFRQFNRNYSQHSPNRSKLMSELSAFLTWKPEQFTIHNVADNLSIVEFFRKLNEILMTDEVNCDYHWTVFKVIDIATNNPETCQYLVDTVRIVTGIANYAVKGSSSLIEQKQIQLWTLVDRITTGMTIITEEPHLANLIDHLVTSVKRTDLREEIKMLQVSILTNLCFKNEVAVACLLRFTKSKALLGAIEEHKIYWGKMSMALARFDSTMLEFELHFNLKTIFAVEYFSQLMRDNDRRLLRNVLDMLVVGFERDEHSRQTMQQFDFKESIEAVLTLIDDSEISFQNFELMNMFLGIVNSILSVSNTTLESIIPRLFKLIIDKTDAATILSESIKTIRLTASSVTDLTNLTPFVVLLIENIQTYQNDLSVTAEVYQLLNDLYTKHTIVLPHETIIKSIDTDTWSYKVTDANLFMQIHRLHWLLSYTNTSDGDVLRRKVEDIMSKKDVHHILASGLKGHNQEICVLTMELIKSQHFPVQSVSEILSRSFTPNEPKNEPECRPPVEIVRPYFSAPLETRLNNEVDRMMKLRTEMNVGTNDHIRILEYQNIVTDAKQEILLTQIKALSDLNTLQSNEIGGLKLTIRNSLNKISELESKLENSKKCADSMKSAYHLIKTKYDQISDLTTQYDKERKAHVANLAQLKKDHERETSDLVARHGSLVKELTEKHERKEKKQKAAHDLDLKKYSTKLSELQKKFEQEKAELLKSHEKETQTALDKIENLEKELATKVEQVKDNLREIEEKTQSLEAARKEVGELNTKIDGITDLLYGKRQTK